MPKIQPWSFTSLDDFKNCPKAFYHKKVLKLYPPDESEHLVWGREVHKAFEERQYLKKPVPLPQNLAVHEPYMARLEALPGVAQVELKVALNRQAQPCGFFGDELWFRGVIDYLKVDGSRATVVDYKTGKPHTKFQQLELFALNVFTLYPEVQTVHCYFYWTRLLTTSFQAYTRSQIQAMWAKFLPDLRQYNQAFLTDTWQMRPSGLCGWCPVTDCQNWRPRRERY